MYQMLGVDNFSWILQPFKSSLILLNLEKNLLPNQLVTTKLRSKVSRGFIN